MYTRARSRFLVPGTGMAMEVIPGCLENAPHDLSLGGVPGPHVEEVLARHQGQAGEDYAVPRLVRESLPVYLSLYGE